jgi:hypothetical protein
MSDNSFSDQELELKSMNRSELFDYLKDVISKFPKSLPQSWSRDMTIVILCPRGFWNDIDSPIVQDVLILLRDEGLLNLVYREDIYLTFNL